MPAPTRRSRSPIQQLVRFLRTTRWKASRQPPPDEVGVAIVVGGLGMAAAEVFPLLRRVHEVLASRGFVVRYFDYAPATDPPTYYTAADTFSATVPELAALLAVNFNRNY